MKLGVSEMLLPTIVALTVTWCPPHCHCHGLVAEGVPNTESLWHRARAAGVRTPLMDQVYAVLYEHKSPKAALRELLGRDPRPEAD